MKLEFIGAIPPLQSSIVVGGGEGEMTRIKIDCYEVDLYKLLQFRGKSFKIIFEDDKNNI